ncbi:MAG: hypothetical protein PVG90_10015 [Bacillota bacterium]|jgi:hypothetical protein
MDEQAKAKWTKFGVNFERCTCLQCPHKDDDLCPFAFDLYNIDGDCLMEK